MDDTQYVLMKDTQEKKRTAHSASRRVGRTRKVTFPYEMMTGKERKKYMGASEVTTFKLRPMTIKEFRATPADKKIDLLKWYGEKYGWNPAGVAAGLDVHYATGKKLLEEYMMIAMFKARMKECTDEQKRQFLENRKALEEERRPKENPEEQDSNQPTQQEQTEPNTTPTEKEKPVQAVKKPITGGFAIQLTGNRKGGELFDRLYGIGACLDKKKSYSVSLLVVELPSDEEQGVSNVTDA